MIPTNLPLYQCHKQVRAAKIIDIRPFIKQGEADNRTLLDHGEIDGTTTGSVVENSWMQKHKPQIGSYFVVYADGYTSCSPAEPFESGYTPIPTDYKDRVRLEHAELVTKITKLATYLESNPEAGILFDQLGAMRLYRDLLAERIASF